jgi:penicillin-binding protein 1B
VRAGRVMQGGSTITQQLIKNRLLGARRTFWRKLNEAWLATLVEWRYPKPQILEAYLNEIYLGQRGGLAVRGVGAAARVYFRKEIHQLTPAEAALLAGMVRAPNSYSPVVDPERARNRRDVVLGRMRELGMLSEADWKAARAEPVRVPPATIVAQPAPYFTDYVRLELEQRWGDVTENVGARVYTSLDPVLQRFAEAAVIRGLDRLETQWPRLGRAEPTRRLQAALVALDPATGEIRALVGGRDYQVSQYNRALLARRQPGSAFKPFVYTAAIDNGFHPTDIIVDEPVSFPGASGELYQPQNYDHQYRGPVTLRFALQQSINIPAIKLLRKVSTSLVASYARRMGIRSPIGQNLSLALGTSEVTLLELVTAYGVFADRGIRNDPLFVLKVEDKNGTVLEKNAPRPVEVLSEETASVMTSMLQSVMDHGTGFPARARGFTIPAAGKTGTMDEYMDAWFVGYTPSLVAGTHVSFIASYFSGDKSTR